MAKNGQTNSRVRARVIEKTYRNNNRAKCNAKTRARNKRRRSNPCTWPNAIMCGVRQRARLLGIECSITANDILSVMPKDGLCPALHWPLKFGGPCGPQSPSVDRINSLIGYTPENIQVISWRANKIKNDASSCELRMIADYIDRKMDGRP